MNITPLLCLVCLTSFAIADNSKALQVVDGEYYIVAKDLGIGNDLYLSLAEFKHAIIPGLTTLAMAALTALTAAMIAAAIAGFMYQPGFNVLIYGDDLLGTLIIPLFLGVITIEQAKKIPTDKTLVLSETPGATWSLTKTEANAFELASSWDAAPKRKGRTIALSSKSQLSLSKTHAVPFRAIDAPGFENSVYLQVMGVIESDNQFLYLKAQRKKYQTGLDKVKKGLWELRPVPKNF